MTRPKLDYEPTHRVTCGACGKRYTHICEPGDEPKCPHCRGKGLHRPPPKDLVLVDLQGNRLAPEV